MAYVSLVTTTAIQPLRFWSTTLGKKAVVAVTGAVLFGYLIAHVAGNLQVFAGEAVIDGYARFLHERPLLLWGQRLVVIAAVVLHVWGITELYRLKQHARPTRYARNRHRGSASSRWMLVSGVLVLAFLVFHILHFTTGHAHPSFQPVRPYSNMVTAFAEPVVVLVYVVAMLLVAVHLTHGLWSFTRSLGFDHPRYNLTTKNVAKGTTALLVLAFIVIPVGVFWGLAP